MVANLVDRAVVNRRQIEQAVFRASVATHYGRPGYPIGGFTGDLTLWERIHTLMFSTPTVAWSAPEIASLLDADAPQVTALLHRRWVQGRIDRPSRGVYQVK